nr:hypothetical protein [uncultured Flavobacterium sp.]
MKKKTLYITCGIVATIVGFITLLASYTSPLSEAKKEIKKAENAEELVHIWNSFSKDVNASTSKKIMTAISDRAEELEVEADDMLVLIDHLPKGKKSMNVIVVPDLSRRIIDEFNNPGQVANDQLIIETIWEEFVKISKFKKQSNDFFSVNVTDLDQAKGTFSSIANNLRLDLSEKGRNQPNRTLFNDSLDQLVKTNVSKLYAAALQQPLGADYKFYFRRYLPNQLKTSDLKNNFRNKLVIITDGYLEGENQPADTKIVGFEKELKAAVINGTIDQKIKQLGLSIPTLAVDLSHTDVLICEVNERKIGKGYHFEILQSYWTQWLENMGAKSVTFIGREQSTQQTQKQIRQFLKK